MTVLSKQRSRPVREPRNSGQDVSALRARLKHERRRKKLWSILTPIALILLWEIASRTGILNPAFFPSPTTILVESARYATDSSMRNDLLQNLRASGFRLAVGYIIGVTFGIILGLVMGLVPVIRYALNAVITATYPLPKLALFPLMIIFFGIGDLSKIAVVALGAFFMTCINTIAGVIYSPPIYRDVAQAFQVPRHVRILRVTIPAAVPSVIGGLRLAYGQSLIIVVSTEFVSGQNGVGFVIWNSWQVLNVSAMFVGLTIVGLVGWLGSSAIVGLGRRLVPWQGSD